MRLRTNHAIVIFVGVGLPPIRDFVLLGNFADAESFFLLMALVNTLSLVPTALLMSRNVDEFPDWLDYLLLPSVWFFGVLLFWGVIASNLGPWSATTVSICVLFSIFNGYLSHLLVSGGQFYVARFAHIPQVVASFLLLFLGITWSFKFSGPTLLLLSQSLGTAVYLGYFFFMIRRSRPLAACFAKFIRKPRVYTKPTAVLAGLSQKIPLYLTSIAPLALSNAGQVILISNLEGAQYDLLSVRLSFYLSALLLFPFGYVVEKGVSGPLGEIRFWHFAVLLLLCVMVLATKSIVTPYIFAVCVVLLRYAGRSIVHARSK